MATAATTAIVQVTVDVAVDEEDPAAIEGGGVRVVVTGEGVVVGRSSKTATKSVKTKSTPLQFPLVNPARRTRPSPSVATAPL